MALTGLRDVARLAGLARVVQDVPELAVPDVQSLAAPEISLVEMPSRAWEQRED